jgi:hypothetical protein
MMNLIKTELYMNNLKDLSKEELIAYMTEYCYSSFAEDIDYTEDEANNCYLVSDAQLVKNII